MKLKSNTGITKANPTRELLNDDLISRALWECLKDGDAEGFLEIISTYLSASKKARLAKKASLARSTVHTLKEGNPTIKTVAKLVHARI